MTSKRLIYALLILVISFNQFFASEPNKQVNAINNLLPIFASHQKIQDSICQYLDTWDNDQIKQYDGHLGLIKQIALSQNGKILASIYNLSDCGNALVKLWYISNIQNLCCINSKTYHDELSLCNSIFDISWDNKYLAQGYTSGFGIYDIRNNKKGPIHLKGTKLDSYVTAIKFANKDFLLVADTNNNLSIYNIANLIDAYTKEEYHIEKKLENIHDTSLCPYYLELSKDNKYLITADEKKTIFIWDAKSLPELKFINKFTINAKTWQYTTGLSLSPDNKYLTATDGSTFIILNMENVKNIRCLKEVRTNLVDLKFIDNKYLACLRNNSTLTIYDISNLEKIKSYDLGQNFEEDKIENAGSLVCCNDGSAIIFAGNNRKLNVVSNLASLLQTNNALTPDRYCKSCQKTDAQVSKLLICGRCHRARYCSTECQRADWKNHKDNCR